VQQVFYGIVLLAVIMFLPNGIWPPIARKTSPMSFDAIVFQTFAPFIKWPAGAFIPAVAFAAAFAWDRRGVTLAPAIAWAIYAVLEMLNKAGITCRGDCNIRVDLLLIYPALWILSIAGVVGLFMGRKRRSDA
jgi:hypothetical protein